MNIDDVKLETIKVPPIQEIFPGIFAKQEQLFRKYQDIERKNGFYKPSEKWLNPTIQEFDSNIEDAQFQNWLKNMFWRVTEEIAEAFENWEEVYGTLIVRDWEKTWANVQCRHYLEELIDGLHFLTEATLFVLNAPQEMYKGYQKHTELHTWGMNPMFSANQAIHAMGLAGNCLKNKPWKNSHVPTDVEKFLACFETVWKEFMKLLIASDLTIERVYQIYFQKHSVNQFRIRSNY